MEAYNAEFKTKLEWKCYYDAKCSSDLSTILTMCI